MSIGSQPNTLISHTSTIVVELLSIVFLGYALFTQSGTGSPLEALKL